MSQSLPGGLYLILDRTFVGERDLLKIAATALEAGVQWIQYREKQLSRRDAFRMSVALQALTRRAGALFIVNDEVDLAMAAGADGVHLGQDDFPVTEARRLLGQTRLIGLSTHTKEEAVQAGGLGADYIGFGPVFESSSKGVRPPVGLGALREVASAVSMPVFAIGGIQPDHVSEVMKSGARGVAVIQGVLGKADVAGAVKDYLKRMDR
jgi:thiamine-phosphate pyrophosphorylase